MMLRLPSRRTILDDATSCVALAAGEIFGRVMVIVLSAT